MMALTTVSKGYPPDKLQTKCKLVLVLVLVLVLTGLDYDFAVQSSTSVDKFVGSKPVGNPR